jgi:four helix bundle protein
MNSNYRQLIAWQKAIDLCVALYEISESFPRAELYGLTSQLRRAGVSVPSNIAEGRGRGSSRDYRRFLLHARGSLFEIETQTEIAARLRFIARAEADAVLEQVAEVVRVINGLLKYLDRKLAARCSPPPAR